MEELLKAITKGILIQQGVNVGSKVFSSKRVTDNDKQGLGLALIAFALLNLPVQQPPTNAMARL